MTCFYCERAFSILTVDHRFTKDHIYPRSLVRQLTKEQRAKLPPAFRDLNTVDCCHGCNAMKGRLHPLDWLVIMPNPHRAKKLAERLIRMGEEIEEVFSAMRRRRVK